MTQILDAIPSNENNSILCCYVNTTTQVKIARITNIDNWYFERVVFPGQRLVFETLPEALIEINSMMANEIIVDKIPCKSLLIIEEKTELY